MNKTILFVAACLITLFSYQNCSGPIQDYGSVDKDSVPDCPVSPAQASIIEPTHTGSSYQFDIFSDLAADTIRWTIQPIISGIITNQPFLVQNILVSGDYIVQAQGMVEGCSTPLYTASRNFSVSSGGQTCNTTLQLNASATEVLVGNSVSISISNSSDFQASSIRWKLNDVDQPNWNDQSSVSYTPNSSGNKTFSVTATANCGSNRNASVTVVANPSATAAASLVNFDAKPFSGATNPIRGSGKDSVYKIARASGKKISLQFANLQSAQSTLTTSTGTNCTFPNCYLFDVVTTSGSCQYTEKTVNATGTNGTVTAFNLFIYCPTNQTYCHTGLLENKEAGENCSGCGVNLYIPTSGSSCVAVGNGYYSPAGNNNRSACTNTKPANSTYNGPGANGTNNCPWTCNSGYHLENNSCVADVTTCEAANMQHCWFPSSPAGQVNGECFTNPSCRCEGICGSDGQIELTTSTCPFRVDSSCRPIQ
ncbi:MAG: hypothetical protein KDD37_05315 [Bdellovibrionales bacterium]|nr:hypothetical protein [Bdellovibrionales bacterium]